MSTLDYGKRAVNPLKDLNAAPSLQVLGSALEPNALDNFSLSKTTSASLSTAQLALKDLVLLPPSQNRIQVTVHQAKAIDPLEGSIFGHSLGKADFYSKVTIGGVERTSGTINDDDDISPNWRFTQDAVGYNVPIKISLYDSDGGLRGNDDHVDINRYSGQRDLVLNYNVSTGQITGSGVVGQKGNLIRVRGAGDSDRGEIAFSINHFNPYFSSYSIGDASGDSSSASVFQQGALKVNYNFANAGVSYVRLEALKNGQVVSTLGSWSGGSLSDGLANLRYSNLAAGDYSLRLVAKTTQNQEFYSGYQTMKVLGKSMIEGTFQGETLNYNLGSGTGAVVLGRGGTDTLNLSGILQSDVLDLNGGNIGSFNKYSSTGTQAIYGGNAFDFLTLKDGRQVYFQGIEKLKFGDGSTLELQVKTNDTYFDNQWNLHVSDVSNAWRFTRGSNGVLLASLDTGILTAAGASGGIHDISTSRLITDSTDDDNFMDYGHGHSAISVMASTRFNGSGVAGINSISKVYVNDVYSGVNLQKAIKDTIAYAKANGMKVVFQGGIQGESWLNSGGTQAELEKLISDNKDIALFAVAAGNGGPGGNLTDPNYLTSVSGVAKLQTNYDNVMSVGALKRTGTSTIDGMTNASNVDLASYSNRGSNLTMVAATDSPAMNKFGNMGIFGGTSCANPNMAGIASLVWSVNQSLSGGQIRQILKDTAMDLGAIGRDNTFGSGLANAEAAVRRAIALARNSKLANLYTGSSVLA